MMRAETPRIIYKGDVLSAWFYIGTGLFMFFVSGILHYFNISLGYLYLSYGLFIFSIYSLGKGLSMWYVYSRRFRLFARIELLDAGKKQAEIQYTNERILRKQSGRRMHTYILILGSILAVCGVLSSEKGLILGTLIPVVLLSGIEFSVGLLTEFRLQEYLRLLQKNENDHEPKT